MNGLSKASLAATVAAVMLASAPAVADGPRGYARAGVHRGASVMAHGYGRQHGGGVRFGLYLGAPLVLSSGYWGPHHYYPAPYYSPYYAPYYPPVVTVPVPVSPPTYVEQGQAAQPQPEPGYWYYCNDARAYYPYVKECPGGWQRVSPQPPPQ